MYDPFSKNLPTDLVSMIVCTRYDQSLRPTDSLSGKARSSFSFFSQSISWRFITRRTASSRAWCSDRHMLRRKLDPEAFSGACHTFRHLSEVSRVGETRSNTPRKRETESALEPKQLCFVYLSRAVTHRGSPWVTSPPLPSETHCRMSLRRRNPFPAPEAERVIGTNRLAKPNITPPLHHRSRSGASRNLCLYPTAAFRFMPCCSSTSRTLRACQDAEGLAPVILEYGVSHVTPSILVWRWRL